MKITLRSVLNGNTFALTDDGHAPGNVGQPNALRQKIEQWIKRVSPLDGKPVWFTVEKQSVRAVGDHVVQPIPHLHQWDESCDARLEAHMGEKAVRPAPLPSPSPRRAELKRKVDEAEKAKAEAEKSMGGGEARMAANAGGVKADDKAAA